MTRRAGVNRGSNIYLDYRSQRKELMMAWAKNKKEEYKREQLYELMIIGLTSPDRMENDKQKIETRDKFRNEDALSMK